MSKRILIVEDEELIAKSVAFALRREGFETETARDGLTALEAARARPPDALILDIILPGELSGSDICRVLRRETIAPIIMLTALGTETDRVLGLERGADDYVTKPFLMHELIARVRAHLRRVEFDRTGSTTTLRRVGGITVDTVRHEVTVEGEPVHLTVSEFELLALLTERPGEVVSRRELVSRLWSSEFEGETRTCDAHVRRLRAKIEHDPARPSRLVTVRGVGYKFVGMIAAIMVAHRLVDQCWELATM
jgi:two-component system response regulator RegX3